MFYTWLLFTFALNIGGFGNSIAETSRQENLLKRG